MVVKKLLLIEMDEFLILINEFGNELKLSLNLKDFFLFLD